MCSQEMWRRSLLSIKTLCKPPPPVVHACRYGKMNNSGGRKIFLMLLGSVTLENVKGKPQGVVVPDAQLA